MKIKINQQCDIVQLNAALKDSGVNSVNIYFEASPQVIEGGVTNVNPIPQIINRFANMPQDDLALMKILYSLPEPRLKNLYRKIIQICMKQFKEYKLMSEFLGMKRNRPRLTQTTNQEDHID